MYNARERQWQTVPGGHELDDKHAEQLVRAINELNKNLGSIKNHIERIDMSLNSINAEMKNKRKPPMEI